MILAIEKFSKVVITVDSVNSGTNNKIAIYYFVWGKKKLLLLSQLVLVLTIACLIDVLIVMLEFKPKERREKHNI